MRLELRGGRIIALMGRCIPPAGDPGGEAMTAGTRRRRWVRAGCARRPGRWLYCLHRSGFEAEPVKNKVFALCPGCHAGLARRGWCSTSGRVCAESVYLAWGSEQRASSSERDAAAHRGCRGGVCMCMREKGKCFWRRYIFWRCSSAQVRGSEKHGGAGTADDRSAAGLAHQIPLARCRRPGEDQEDSYQVSCL
jgi:hypothetical protein